MSTPNYWNNYNHLKSEFDAWCEDPWKVNPGFYYSNEHAEECCARLRLVQEYARGFSRDFGTDYQYPLLNDNFYGDTKQTLDKNKLPLVMPNLAEKRRFFKLSVWAWWHSRYRDHEDIYKVAYEFVPGYCIRYGPCPVNFKFGQVDDFNTADDFYVENSFLKVQGILSQWIGEKNSTAKQFRQLLEDDPEWIKLVKRFARNERVLFFKQLAIARKQSYASVLDHATIDDATNEERIKNGLPPQATCPPAWTLAQADAQLKLQEFLFPATPSVCRYLIHRAMGAEMREVDVLPRRGALIESVLLAKDSPEPIPLDRNGRRMVWRERTNLVLQRQYIEVKYFLESLYTDIAVEMKRQSKWLQEEFEMSLTVEGKPGRQADDDALGEIAEICGDGCTVCTDAAFTALLKSEHDRRLERRNIYRELHGCEPRDGPHITAKHIKQAVQDRLDKKGISSPPGFTVTEKLIKTFSAGK